MRLRFTKHLEQSLANDEYYVKDPLNRCRIGRAGIWSCWKEHRRARRKQTQPSVPPMQIFMDHPSSLLVLLGYYSYTIYLIFLSLNQLIFLL